MESLLAAKLFAPVFQAGARSFSLRDIFDAAAERGALADFRAAWQSRREAATQTEAAGLQPEETAVEAASNAFRYARDLVTAEECEHWLAQRGLVFEDLTASLTRRLQAELAGETKDPQGRSPRPGGVSESTDFYRDVLLADEFTEWARGLAWRVALAVAETGGTAEISAGTDPMRQRTGAVQDAGAWGDVSSTDWTKFEHRFADACEKISAPECQRRELSAHRLELTRLLVAAAEFDSSPAAREAFLCAQEDGTTIGEIAQTNGFSCAIYERLWEDFTPDWQAALLSACPGEVVPPLPHGEGFVVLQLLDKWEPSLEAADVRARLAKNLERRFFGELEAKHIRWLLKVEVEA